jgi:arylsulfatase A-like enzyme
MSHNENNSGPSRRDFIKTVAVGTAVLAAPAFTGSFSLAASTNTKRPNILFFLGEGMRADEMSAAGNPIIETPHFDRIMREGMNFSNAFVVNALCLPARATAMTGMYSHATGCIDNRDRRIPSNIPILSDLLSQAGYEVAFVGKSHVGGALRDHYWDYYFGFNGQSNYYHPTLTEGISGKFGPDRVYDGYVDDIMTDHAVKWLSGKHEKPVCLFFWPYAPHSSFYRPRKLLDLYNGVKIPKPATFDDDLKGYPGKPKAFVNAENKIGTTEVGKDTPRSLEELVKDHYAGVVATDINLGRIMDVLEKQGVLDDTAIILTSDHGFFLGEWRCYDKRLMHEPSIRVPLAIRYPKMVTAGLKTDKMALNTDMVPTILDLAGVAIPAGVQGKSLVPFLQGKPPADWRKDWLYEYYEYPEYEHVAPHRGIRTERYKLIHYYLDPEEFELYDLQNDPGERNNLYSNPQYAPLVRQLRSRLEELRKETGDTGSYDVNEAYINAAPKNSIAVSRIPKSAGQ